MSPFLKPSIGIGIGAGLAVATFWCSKQMSTDEPFDAGPTVQLSYSVGNAATEFASEGAVRLVATQEEGPQEEGPQERIDTELPSLVDSLNPDSLTALLNDSQVTLRSIPPMTAPTSEIPECLDQAEEKVSDQYSNAEQDLAAVEWPSLVTNLNQVSEANPVAVNEPFRENIPVVFHIRKPRNAPTDGVQSVSARRTISSGPSINKNPYFAAAQNRRDPQVLTKQVPAFQQGGLTQETVEQNKSLNSSALNPDDADAQNSNDATPKKKASAVDSNKGGIVLTSENSISPASTTSGHGSDEDLYERVFSSPIVFEQSPRTVPSSGPLRLSHAVAVRAVQHIEYGKTLARRGAKASAKQEFMTALSLLAQDFDTQSNTDRHSQSLRRGTVALKEAEEFVANDSESQIGMKIDSLVESHQSGALTKQEATGLSSMQALQRYFGFAQLQIENSVGKNVVSAEALFCLGRLYTLVDSTGVAQGKLDRARAMVYHRASLNCDPSNYRSAHELGVLLAEFGELHESVELLKESLIIRQTPTSWENLAKVHGRLNQPELASLAAMESQRTLSNQSSGMIRWLEQSHFNDTAPAEVIIASNPVSNSQPKQRSSAGEQTNPENSGRKSLPEQMKSWF
jgi:tetratricopeptide (TPR) repeat protein